MFKTFVAALPIALALPLAGTLPAQAVDGNVQVKRNATLVARGVEVGGKSVRSRVGGSIQLKQVGGVLRRNVVDSDIQLFSNDGGFEVYRNTVGGTCSASPTSRSRSATTTASRATRRTRAAGSDPLTPGESAHPVPGVVGTEPPVAPAARRTGFGGPR